MFNKDFSNITLFCSKNEIDEINNICKNEDNESITVIKEDNITIINIEETQLSKFTLEMQEKLELIDKDNFLYSKDSTDIKLKKQRLYLFWLDNYQYSIAVSNDELIIYEYGLTDIEITKTRLHLFDNNKYKLEQTVLDCNYQKKYYKEYPACGTYAFSKNSALKIIRKILSNLNRVENIEDIVYTSTIYNWLNIMPENRYCMISDEVISLFSVYGEDETRWFDIVLNETKEIVGDICIHNSEDFSYEGNVGYTIKREFRNNHYATRALKLLKELVKSKSGVRKTLYVATLPNNIKSQKVALNNGGVLCYDGSVPKNERINYIDGVEKVKVYRI